MFLYGILNLIIKEGELLKMNMTTNLMKVKVHISAIDISIIEVKSIKRKFTLNICRNSQKHGLTVVPHQVYVVLCLHTFH